MIRNHLKIIWRNLVKDRRYTLTSLFGLSVAFSVVMIVTAYVRYETSFDRYYDNAERVYRLVRWNKTMSEYNGIQHADMGYDLEATFPEVEGVTYFFPNYDQNEVMLRSEHGSVPTSYSRVDTAFFDVFDVPFSQGSSSDTRRLGTVVLTKTLAEQLFPNQDPIGKTVHRPERRDSTSAHIVCAVVDDIPSNSHFRSDAFFVNTKVDKQPLTFGGSYSSRPQYIMLKEQVSYEEFQKKMNAYFVGKGMSENEEIQLLPVRDIHLHASHIESMGGQVQDAKFVYIFGMSGVLMLLIACINHVNLYLARLIPRGKEMGIRKILGAAQGHLIIQVLIESCAFFLLSLPIAALIAYLCWPAFGNLLEISTDITDLINVPNLLVVLGLTALCSFAVSIYPTIRLRRDDAVALLKQKTGQMRLTLAPQKVLMVLQFTIAVVLIVATVVIYTQVQFFVNRSMGFDKDYLLVLPKVGDKPEVFKEKLLVIPTISNVSFANSANIGSGYGASSSMTDPRDSTRHVDFAFLDTDLDFIPTMKAELVKGRHFTQADAVLVQKIYDDKSKSGSWMERYSKIPIIITESAAERLEVNSVDTALALGALQGNVIGVVKDFQLTSFREEANYAVFRAQDRASGNAYIRIASHNIPNTIAHIQDIWRQVFPNEEFEYHFVDEQIRKMYKKEDLLASLFTISSLISISISALGLLSLIALMVKQRTKEIGIRKVLGASVSAIVGLFSKDFVKLVLIAILIASPIAWWLMNKWLEDFAYRIDVQWWMFVLAGLLAVAIALFTVGIQAIRAARANPVDSLRDE